MIVSQYYALQKEKPTNYPVGFFGGFKCAISVTFQDIVDMQIISSLPALYSSNAMVKEFSLRVPPFPFESICSDVFAAISF
jgi:hypothetical protein